MEVVMLILLILNVIASIVIIILGLLIGSVMVRVLEMLQSLMTTGKQRKEPADRPWYTYIQ